MGTPALGVVVAVLVLRERALVELDLVVLHLYHLLHALELAQVPLVQVVRRASRREHVRLGVLLHLERLHSHSLLRCPVVSTFLVLAIDMILQLHGRYKFLS